MFIVDNLPKHFFLDGLQIELESKHIMIPTTTKVSTEAPGNDFHSTLTLIDMGLIGYL